MKGRKERRYEKGSNGDGDRRWCGRGMKHETENKVISKKE